MKVKKKLLSIVALLIVSLSFGAGASAQHVGEGDGPRPICTNNGHCYYP